MDTSMPSSSTQTIKKPFPILDLPPEIRLIVLGIMLVPPRMLVDLGKYDPKFGRPGWKVLLACKQLYEEGRHLLYSQNVFYLSRIHHGGDPFTPFFWESLNSAAEESLARIQRVAVDLDIQESFVLWSQVTQIISYLYNSAPGLRAFRPAELIVTDLQLRWWRPEGKEYFVDGDNKKARLDAITSEECASVRDPNTRPLQERCALDERDSKILFHIHALNLRDFVLATLAELQKLDPALMHVYVASARGHPNESRRRWILIFSSKKRAPYHLSTVFSTLICRLEVDVERKRVRVAQKHDYKIEETA
ncbi:hypothetical protein GJ744_005392 [Endocarpon pusillum]|uniref:F-box domain-containing protein n=1 Tax=Endocarpon pusillum TaxID=364733 RepID=A0A8H7A8P9_9EURO|nr:hypothetical protein GJ744_005392 [Endocarpon pusillum]